MSVPFGLKKSAAMVILRSGDQFLLLKRSKNPNRDKYTPVGGKLEPFEDPYTAALRETEEETGFKLDAIRYVGYIVESSPTKYNWHVYCYLADIPYQDPPFCDEGTLEWIHKDQIAQLNIPATDYVIYDYVTEGRPFALNAVMDEELNIVTMVEEIANEKLI